MSEKKEDGHELKRELVHAEKPSKHFNPDAFADKFATKIVEMVDTERKRLGLPPLKP